MAHIVNSSIVRTLAIDLGWDNLNTSELHEWMTKAGIDPIGVVAFMQALKDNPKGIDDGTVVEVSTGQLPYVEEWFRNRGFIF